jgi:glycosyltransferase involved in cell wall biosynthesis
MGRDMPSRVTYWTGIWQPHREALSKQVAQLRAALDPGAPVFSLSAGQPSSWPRDGVWRLSMRHYNVFRVLAAGLERRGRVTHAFGSVDAWHFLRVLGRRPLLMTVALPGAVLDAATYRHVRRFAVETDALADVLCQGGVSADRIEVIPPGIDLAEFTPTPPPDTRFRVVFASTPADPAEFEIRGIPMLVELARARYNIDVVLQWRQWGPLSEAERLIARMDPPENLILDRRDVNRMSTVYQQAHATVCCFAEGFGKSAPNSVIESLACGRPALLTDTCGLSRLVQREGAGVVVPRTVEDLARGVDELQAGYEDYARRARALAIAQFDEKRIIERYGELYRLLADGA